VTLVILHVASKSEVCTSYSDWYAPYIKTQDIIVAIQEADVVWKSDLKFDGHALNETIKLDSHLDGYAEGTGPKRLLLVSLAGCTAMDVASMLTKMRVPYSQFKVRAIGDTASEHPKVYKTMHIIYEIDADEEYMPKIEMAIEKSRDKYCGVHAMLSKAAPITHEVVLTKSGIHKIEEAQPED
jgi:putative redox protein